MNGTSGSFDGVAGSQHEAIDPGSRATLGDAAGGWGFSEPHALHSSA